MAATAAEAQKVIQEQIDSRMKPLLQCVQDFRTAKKSDVAIVVNVVIDDGRLVGISSADKKHRDLDPTLRGCMFAALKDAAFPRSRAGILSVRQTFGDTVVTQ